jgi:hypothetical protein
MNSESGLAAAFALNILQHLVKKEKVLDTNREARCTRKYRKQGDLREGLFLKFGIFLRTKKSLH